MKRLPADANDGDLLRAIAEWVELLAEERYQDAYDFTYHPWLALAPVNDFGIDSLKAVTNYLWDTPHPNGPFKVTPVGTAPPKESPPDQPPYQDIVRYDEPDRTLRSGDLGIGVVHFDLPLDGQWSDMTAIFRIVFHDEAVVLELETIDVL